MVVRGMKLKVFLRSFLLLSCLSGLIMPLAYAEDKSKWLKNEPISPIPNVTGLDAKKIALGKRLFHDASLSADGTVSCASCHALTSEGVDFLAVSVGINGPKGTRNVPTVINSSLLFRQFWDGRVATLEEQVSGPLTNPVEMANIGAPFLLHETLGCPIANLHSARSDLWEPQFVLRPTQLRKKHTASLSLPQMT